MNTYTKVRNKHLNKQILRQEGLLSEPQTVVGTALPRYGRPEKINDKLTKIKEAFGPQVLPFPGFEDAYFEGALAILSNDDY